MHLIAYNQGELHQLSATHQNVKIGGASGYWGESAMATPQLLASGGLDYIVYDYLAEITMSILARAKAKDPAKGYATDFVDYVMKPFLPMIASSGVKIIANAGGVNPQSCAEAVRALIAEKGLNLKVGIVTGDDFMPNKEAIAAEGLTDMFSGAPFPPVDTIMSINSYLGAFPIAKALDMGADIIITGRCVDSAVTLGALIHEFGWRETDWDKLASGSLAGHILECGPQATGGNFTDWEAAGDIVNIGYPIAICSEDGSFDVTKPEGTGGLVSVGTVSEQMLYEIGDPRSYILPDVVCDFSNVEISQIGKDCVHVSAAHGLPAPPAYKTCMTYMDGYRAGTYLTLYGARADEKAQKLCDAAFARARKTMAMFGLGDFTETSVEIIGAGSQMGAPRSSDEVVAKVAVKHPDMRGVGIFLKELAGIGLATPPGLSGFTGAGRPRPSPVVRLFSYLNPKDGVQITIDVDGQTQSFEDRVQPPLLDEGHGPTPKNVADASLEIQLIKLAFTRSGDKGDTANIGVIARKPDYLPYIWATLTPEYIANHFSHFGATPESISRFYMPGAHAMNILINTVLGGGGAASLRNDAQAKGYSQILLNVPISVTEDIAKQVGLN
ncbi:acyclic terpene utilization AtuA family protein [Robiginitomaculum antarcticum]|uniref:acyclic terpene utilization AtuA family protein n=1 Tax=Robiginitomaculum antarcticum TaxID=437507 RepID=UPI000685C228